MRNVKMPRNSAERRRCPFTPPYPDDPDDPQDYGDRGECAVCHKPLDKPPQPEGPQFCDSHDRDDYRAKVKRDEERRWEDMEKRLKQE